MHLNANIKENIDSLTSVIYLRMYVHRHDV